MICFICAVCDKNGFQSRRILLSDFVSRLRTVFNILTYIGFLHLFVADCTLITRKLSYRKDDRAMRPMYGCPENFQESLTTPTATFPKFVMGFYSDGPSECTG